MSKSNIFGRSTDPETPLSEDQIAQLKVQAVPVPVEIELSFDATDFSADVLPEQSTLVTSIDRTNPKDLIGATKSDISLVPSASILHTASAMMDGAVKYGPYNWRLNPVKARVYIAAAQRHLAQYLDGEDIDPISGVLHLGHASACLAILMDARETGNLLDNRPVNGAASDMIRRWEPETKFK